MKKLVFCLTIAAFASVASLQAGEGKDCAAACDKSAKVAKASECSKSAKAAECSKSTACCASKKANALAKGATQLRQFAKRS
jgi:hypothetical protein